MNLVWLILFLKSEIIFTEEKGMHHKYHLWSRQVDRQYLTAYAFLPYLFWEPVSND